MQASLWPRRLLGSGVRGYRLLLKPWLGNVCRFEPSCSSYALQALDRHGALAGAALTAGRILRCHPWCAAGYDPVPDTFHRPGRGLFSRLLAGPPPGGPDPDPASSPPLSRKLP